MTFPMMIFSGNANIPLAKQLSEELSIPLGQAKVDHFSDGESNIEILENVRGRDVFIVQSTCAPASENLMELLLMADAMRRASAGRITAVMPYFGFARQDRRARSARVPITAKVVADMIASVGVERVITVDLHADQIQGFFHVPLENVYSTVIMLEDIQKQALSNIMLISPDVGGVVRARAFAKHLPGSDLAIIDKRRPRPNETQVMHLIGEVKNCDCIIIDDIVDTAGTLCKAAGALKERGAHKVLAYATHPVLSGDAITTIQNSPLDELIVTDTIPLGPDAKACTKIRQLSLSKMLAQALRRIREAESLSSMFT